MNKKQIETIRWNIINSLLAGALVFLGTAADGEITIKGIIAAFLIGGLVAVQKFKSFWNREKPKNCLFEFR